MTAPNRRKNYLSKRDLQIKMIAKLVLMVLASTLISILITSVLYYELSNVPFKGDIPFYYVTEDIPAEGTMPTAFDVLFPGLMVTGVIMVVVTSVIGVFATHKIAGAIYRFQLNSKEVGAGNLSIDIKLRDKDEFHDLAGDFNSMLLKIRQRIIKARDLLLKASGLFGKKDDQAVKLVKEAIAAIEEFKLEEEAN
ncbi:MAG: HAMP domain-containing protein [bacterium]